MTFESAWPNRWLSRLAVVVLCAAAALTGRAQAGNGAIVFDGSTGKVVDAVNPDELDHPASLTKMMTLYLTFQALKRGRLTIDERLPVSLHAADMQPTKLGLRPGQTISVHDCILGMVTMSANDAATVVAEKLGGTESGFVEMMNAQALMLGLTRTHFGSASGLPGHFDATTARDIGKLAMALYRDFPERSRYFATREFVFQGRVVRGHNRLMYRYPGMDGLKTGFTDAAGFNLASTAVRDGRRLFGVVLGGRTAAVRDNLMARLLDDSFAHRETPPVLVANATIPDRQTTNRSMGRRLLAALSPIGTAAAETVPAMPRERVRSQHSRRTRSLSRHERLAEARTARMKHRAGVRGHAPETRLASTHRHARSQSRRERSLAETRSARVKHSTRVGHRERDSRLASTRHTLRKPVGHAARLAAARSTAEKSRTVARAHAHRRSRKPATQLATHRRKSWRGTQLASRNSATSQRGLK